MSERKTGTFLVTGVDSESTLVRDVHGGQVHTLSEAPDLAVDDVLEATVEPEPPLEVTWRVSTVDARRTIAVEESDQRPTRLVRDTAVEQETGELTHIEREGEGELHVITVPECETEEAVADVIADETTLVQAAMLGVERVEVRSNPGVVSVRYLPGPPKTDGRP